jgi:hypothetical protein
MVEKRGVTPLILNLEIKLKVQVNFTLPLLCDKEKSHRYPPNRKLDGLQKPAMGAGVQINRKSCL